MSSTSSKKSRIPDPAGARPPDAIERDGERWIVIGELVGVHGIRGELRLRPFNPQSAVLSTVEAVLLLGTGFQELVGIRGARPHGRVWLVLLDGVDAPETARELVGRKIAVRESDLEPCGDGEYYHYQLIGLRVVDEDGVLLGVVRDVISAAGSDVLSLDAHGEERLVPMVDEVVLRVDVEAGTILVRPIAGLFGE